MSSGVGFIFHHFSLDSENNHVPPGLHVMHGNGRLKAGLPASQLMCRFGQVIVNLLLMTLFAVEGK